MTMSTAYIMFEVNNNSFLLIIFANGLALFVNHGTATCRNLSFLPHLVGMISNNCT